MPEFAYIWDQRLRSGAGAYRNPTTGQILPNMTARAALDNYIDSSQDTPTALYELMRGGQISVADWQLQMRDHIKSVNLNAAIAATGGRDNMTQADWGRAGQLIRRQYEYLDEFALQIANGLPLDGRFLTRMKMYTEAGTGTYHSFMTNRYRNAGYDFERSVLETGRKIRHCTGSGSCVEQAARGWQPIGEMIPIGRRVCLTRDRCGHEFKNSLTGEIA